MANWTEGTHKTGYPMWSADDKLHVILQLPDKDGKAVFWLYQKGKKGVHKKCKTLKLAKAAVS